MCLESKKLVSKPELKLPCANFTNLQCSLISCRALLSASKCFGTAQHALPRESLGIGIDVLPRRTNTGPFPHPPADWPGWKVTAGVTGELGTGHVPSSPCTAQHRPWHCCTPAKIHRSSRTGTCFCSSLSSLSHYKLPLEEGLGWPKDI